MGNSKVVSVLTNKEADLLSIHLEAHGERYMWIGKISNMREVMREIGRDAANKELCINWDDVGFIKQVLRDYFPGELIPSKFVRVCEMVKKLFKWN